MDAQRWQRAQELFVEALEAADHERGPLLEAGCGGDAELRGLVERLLRADADVPSILTPRGDPFEWLLEDDRAPIPARLGPWAIRGELGHGGMGTVYEAERADGSFERTVAIKVIHVGLDAEEAVRRFQSEGRILARLEHPNIARLYDAGVHEGQPYLVMELVSGERIDRHCDARQLDVRRRLELFIDVCDAVHYAHQSLVIHRDLKPSNILVTPDAEPRLLDFGIAELVGEEGGPGATRPGSRALTPEYSSPEQLRGQPVTTASDVYSLGVVLHELLTGARPDAPVHEPRTIAEARGTTPKGLARVLRGDLDAITRRALQEQPSARYTSVQGLADDVRRYLAREPVSARPDTIPYRARRFVRRHVAGVTAIAAVAVALVGGLTAAVWQARVASTQRDVARLEAAKANRVTDFLIDVFQVADPAEARADTLTAAQILRRGAARVETELGADPAVQATVIDAIGRVYSHLSMFAGADTLLRRALARRIQLLGPDHPDVAQSVHNLAELARARSDPSADSLYRVAIALRRAALPPGDPALAESLVGHAYTLIGIDDGAAEAALNEALEIFRAAPGDYATDIASVTYALGFIRQSQGRYDEADRLYREALAVQAERLGPTDPATLTTRYNLGFLLQVMGRYTAADSALQAVLAARREVYGNRHQRVSNSLYGLAELRYAQGDYESAEAYIREAIELRTELHGAGHDQVIFSSLLLAQILLARGDAAAAEEIFDRLLIATEARGRNGTGLARALNGYAAVLEGKGDLAGAESFYRRAWRLYRDALGDSHPFSAIVESNVAAMLHDQGDLAGAEPLYREALGFLRAAYGDDHASVGTTTMLIGTLEMQTGRLDTAERTLTGALDILERALPPSHWRLGQAKMRLGACLADLGRYEEAEPLLEAAREIIEPQRGARFGDWRQLLTEFYDLHMALGQPDRAAEYQRLFRETESHR